MAQDDALPARELSAGRALVPVLAAVFGVLAPLTDQPEQWWRAAVLAVPVAAFAAWYRWAIPLPALAVAVIGGVACAQWEGNLEGSFFLVSLLALVAAGWGRPPVLAWAVVLLSVATSPLMALLRPDAHVSWVPWAAGTAFPAVLGWTIRRQEQLTAELARARRELAERAVLDERRRIARDVHDLVGHGLASVLLQVTSARHVLRRDPDSADEALRSAEAAGRASMQDLRATVGLLRVDDDAPPSGPLPGLGQLPDLVRTYRAAGLDVGVDLDADGGTLAPAVGLTLYRIAQEALANAARHAPDARTRVRAAVGLRSVTLAVTSAGPLRADPPDSENGHYGLLGMRERADVVGGTLHAGRTVDGWSVTCEVPLDPPSADGGDA